MKKQMNRRGYALLIVLFTIIIFLSLSAVLLVLLLTMRHKKTTDHTIEHMSLQKWEQNIIVHIFKMN